MTAPEPGPALTARPTRVRYRVIGYACTLSMITYLDRVCFGAAAPQIAAELGVEGIAGLKWAFTAFAIAYSVFEIPAGALGDRLGPRGTLLRIVLWWSACTALTGLVGMRVGGTVLGGLGTLVALRFLFGAGEAGAYPNITRALHNWIPPHRWELSQGLVWMSGRLIGGLTPLISALLIGASAGASPWMTWRGTFALFGSLGVIWAVAFALGFRNRPAEHPGVNAAEIALIGPGGHAPAKHGPIPWAFLLRSRSLWALCILYFAANYAGAFNFTYLPAYMGERFGITPEDTRGALYKGAPMWVGALGCLLGGLLVDGLARLLGDRRRARRFLGAGAFAVGAICWWGATGARDVLLFCGLISMAAFCIDLTLGSAWASCQDLGREHAGVTAACMNTIGTLGAAASGWLTGTFVEHATAARAGALRVAPKLLTSADKHLALLAGYQVAFATYIAVFALGALCWLLVNPGAGLGPKPGNDGGSDVYDQDIDAL